MGIFDDTALDPRNDPNTEIWPATWTELQRRGITVHGSLSKVDKGATAVVLKGTETASGRIVAVKVYTNPDQHHVHRNGDTIPMTNFFENERRMLVGLERCPSVPRYYYSVDSDSALSGEAIQPFHVTEFISGKRVTEFRKESLQDNAKNRSGRLVHLFQQVVQTVESIHQFGYLHRDISEGNVLIQPDGQIRLVDLAEASPLGDEHTRLVTTPGEGTDGVASEAQREVRAIQADDVNATCTIGYFLFTGDWKKPGEDVKVWGRKLKKAGAPTPMANLLLRGMKPRNTNVKRDENVWNTPTEVAVAIQSYRSKRRARRRAFRWMLGFAVAAVFIAVVVGFARWHVQSHAFLQGLNELEKERTSLADQPFRSDPRVEKLIAAADELEREAKTARSDDNTAEAVRLLEDALAKLQQANTLASNLDRVSPLGQHLQVMLNNTKWNTDCQAIREQLETLQKGYLAINEEIESGDPEQAWEAMSRLQRELVRLIHDNQQSDEIAALFDRFDSTTVGMDAELAAMPDYERAIAEKEKAYQSYYQRGKWPEARTAILAQQQALRAFLDEHEDADKKAARLAANADFLDELKVENQSLQRRIESLTTQLTETQDELTKLDAKNTAIIVDAAKTRTERDQEQKRAGELRGQIAELEGELLEHQTEFAETGKRLQQAEDALRNEQARSESAESQRATHQTAMERLATEKAAADQRFEAIKRELSTVRHEAQEAMASLQVTEKELDRWKSASTQGETDKLRWSKLYNDLQQKVDRDVGEVEAAQATLTEAQAAYTNKLNVRQRLLTKYQEASPHVRYVDGQLVQLAELVDDAQRKCDEADRVAFEEYAEARRSCEKERERLISDELYRDDAPEVKEIDGQIWAIWEKQKVHKPGYRRATGERVYVPIVAGRPLPPDVQESRGWFSLCPEPGSFSTKEFGFFGAGWWNLVSLVCWGVLAVGAVSLSGAVGGLWEELQKTPNRREYGFVMWCAAIFFGALFFHLCGAWWWLPLI